MRKGTKVHFNPESGNDTAPTYTVSASEKHHGLSFFRLKELSGLFLRERFVTA